MLLKATSFCCKTDAYNKMELRLVEIGSLASFWCNRKFHFSLSISSYLSTIDTFSFLEFHMHPRRSITRRGAVNKQQQNCRDDNVCI